MRPQKRDEAEQKELNDELKSSVMSVVESRMAAARQAIAATLDQCTEEIRAGVSEAISPDAAEVNEGQAGHLLAIFP